MPKSKEFAVRMEDRPGILGKVCRALADRGVNILAFHSFPSGGESLVRLVVDNPTTAKTVLDTQRLNYTEAEVVQVKLAHRPGELARAASRLGDANININYAYCGRHLELAGYLLRVTVRAGSFRARSRQSSVQRDACRL